MAAAPKARRAREAKHDNIGEVGRLTGAPMPKNVPLTEEGVEDYEAFFSPPQASKSNGAALKSARSKQRMKAMNTSSGIPLNNADAHRREDRPDKAHELGMVGRKTGVRMRDNVPKNAMGVEDIDAFFRSPTNTIASVNLMSAKSTVSIRDVNGMKGASASARRRVSSVGLGRRETISISRGRRQTDYGLDESVQLEDDMEIDEDSGLSPRSYIRSQQGKQNASTQSHRRGQTKADGLTNFDSSPAPYAAASRPSTVVDIRGSSEENLSDEEDAREATQIKEQLTPPRAAASSSKRFNAALSDDDDDNEPVQDFGAYDNDDDLYPPDDNAMEDAQASADFDNSHEIRRHSQDEDDSMQLPDLNKKSPTVPQPSDPGKENQRQGSDDTVQPAKKRRGRPPKNANTNNASSKSKTTTKDKRGKAKAAGPSHVASPARDEPHSPPKRKPGRPRKDALKAAPSSSQGQVDGSSQQTAYVRQKRKRDDSADSEGLRRSEREVVPVLEHWRNERIVYNRRQSGPQPCYGIKDVVRFEPEELPSWARSKNKRAKTKTRAKRDLDAIEEDEGENLLEDYSGWDDTTDPEAIVYDYVKADEVKRRIAFPASMIETKPAGKQNYRFQKIFSEGDFLAGGLLEIPVNEKKPLKPARDNSYILFCHHGAVRVLVYRSSFTIATGGFFMVPRGNSYEIENIGHTDAKIVFLQGRELKVIEEVEEEDVDRSRASS